MKRWESQSLLTSVHTTDLDQDPVIGTEVVMLVIEIHEVIENSEMIIAAVGMVEIIAAVGMVENEVEPIPNRRDKIRLVYSSS